MLNSIGLYQDEELVKVAKEICRWHHERYDGRGYPDGRRVKRYLYPLRSFLWLMFMTLS